MQVQTAKVLYLLAHGALGVDRPQEDYPIDMGHQHYRERIHGRVVHEPSMITQPLQQRAERIRIVLPL